MKADEETREAGLSDSEWEQLFEPVHADNEAREKAVIARGQLNDEVVAIAQDWLIGHGYDIPSDSPDYRSFAIRFHRAMFAATKVAKARSEGEWAETPAAPVAPPTHVTHFPKPRKTP